MSLDVQVWMASKEVAERLNVHVRTLRNWLDMFVPATDRLKNPQGHYLISEAGFRILKEVKERKETGNASLRIIQRQLVDEGILPADMLSPLEDAAASDVAPNDDTLASQVALREVEAAVQETLNQFRQELASLCSLQQLHSTLLKKIADIEERQESLRLEMRRVTFEMDLMHQRLTRRKKRFERHQPRWSLNPFRWFSRSERGATADSP